MIAGPAIGPADRRWTVSDDGSFDIQLGPDIGEVCANHADSPLNLSLDAVHNVCRHVRVRVRERMQTNTNIN